MTSIFRKSFISKNSLLHELNKVYGLNNFKSTQLLKKYGLHKKSKVNEISKDTLDDLCKLVETTFLADIDLKKAHMASTHRVAGIKNHHGLFLRILLKKDKDDNR